MEATYSVPASIGVLESYLAQYASLAREVGMDPKVAASMDSGVAASASQSYNIFSILGVDQAFRNLPVPCDADGPLSKPGVVGLLRAAMIRLPVTKPSHDQALLMESGVYDQVTIPPCALGDACCFIHSRDTMTNLSALAKGRALRPLCQYMSPNELSDLVDLRKAPTANGTSCLLCMRRNMTAVQLAFYTVIDHLAAAEHPVDYVLQPFISSVVGEDAYSMDSVIMPRADAYTGMIGPFAKYDISKLRATMHPHLKDCIVVDQTAMHAAPVPRAPAAIASSSLSHYAMSVEALFRRRSNDPSWRAERVCSFVEYHDPVASLLRANPTRTRDAAASLAAAKSDDPLDFVARTVFDPLTADYPTCHTLADMGPLVTDSWDYLCGRKLRPHTDQVDIVVAKCVPLHSLTRAFASICSRAITQSPRAASYIDAIVRCALLGNYPGSFISQDCPIGKDARAFLVSFLGASPTARLLEHDASVVVVWCVRMLQIYRWNAQSFLTVDKAGSLVNCVCTTVAAFRRSAQANITDFAAWSADCVAIAARAHVVFRRDCLLARVTRRRLVRNDAVSCPRFFPLDYDTFVLHTKTSAPVTLAWCGVCGLVQTAVAGPASTAAAGFVKSVTTNRATVSCNSGDQTCRDTPLRTAVMVGRVAIHNGTPYVLCTNKECGRMTTYPTVHDRWSSQTHRILCIHCSREDRMRQMIAVDPFLGNVARQPTADCAVCQRRMTIGVGAKRARGAVCADFGVLLCAKCGNASRSIDVDNRLHFIDRVKETIACNTLYARGARSVRRRTV